jgi:hypothetical protein
MGSDFWAACAFILLAGLFGWSLRGRVGRQYSDGVVDGFRLCRDPDGVKNTRALEALEGCSKRWPEVNDADMLRKLAAARKRAMVELLARP